MTRNPRPTQDRATRQRSRQTGWLNAPRTWGPKYVDASPSERRGRLLPNEPRKDTRAAGFRSSGRPIFTPILRRAYRPHGLGRKPYDWTTLLEIAVKMPLNISRGFGGHPGTATSTGSTLETRPQLA